MTNLLANGDFEAGNITGWTVTYETGYELETTGIVDARASAAQGGSAYGMYCRVTCIDYHRFEHITSATFSGAWSKIEFWYNVTEHYLTPGAGNLIQLDVSVSASGTGGYYEALEFYRDTNNGDALEGWQKVTIYRSDIVGLLDGAVCSIQLNWLVSCGWNKSSRGTVNFDNVVVTPSTPGGAPLAIGDKAIVLPALGGKRIILSAGTGGTTPSLARAPTAFTATDHGRTGDPVYIDLAWTPHANSDKVRIERGITPSTPMTYGTLLDEYPVATTSVQTQALSVDSPHYFSAWGKLVDAYSSSRLKASCTIPAVPYDFTTWGIGTTFYGDGYSRGTDWFEVYTDAGGYNDWVVGLDNEAYKSNTSQMNLIITSPIPFRYVDMTFSATGSWANNANWIHYSTIAQLRGGAPYYSIYKTWLDIGTSANLTLDLGAAYHCYVILCGAICMADVPGLPGDCGASSAKLSNVLLY